MRKKPLFVCSMCSKTQDSKSELILFEAQEIELNGKKYIDKLYICGSCCKAIETDSLFNTVDWCTLRVAEIAVQQYIKRQLRVFNAQYNDPWRNPR